MGLKAETYTLLALIAFGERSHTNKCTNAKLNLKTARKERYKTL